MGLDALVSPARTQQLAEAISRSGLPLQSDERGLPRPAEELLRRRNRLSSSRKFLQALEQFASHLDVTFPSWPEAAIAIVLSSGDEAAAPPGSRREGRLHTAQAAASLLALRPQIFCAPLCRALARPGEAHRRELAALSLFGTERAEVRVAFRQAFAALAGKVFPADSPESRTLWLILARLAQEKSLSYEDFRLLALGSQLLQPEGCSRSFGASGRRVSPRKGRLTLHPCLDGSGLSRQPELRRLYSMLVAEIVPVGGRESPPWPRLRWIRCFPGADYFFEALDRLERSPATFTAGRNDNLLALFMLRWSQDIGEDGPHLAERLMLYSPRTLMLASLLRPHLDETVAEVLGSPLHAPALRWLRLPCRAAAESGEEAREYLLPWAETNAGLLREALGLLCSVQVPEEEPALSGQSPEFEGAVRLQRFLCFHLLPTFPNVMDNLLLLDGLRGFKLEGLVAEAEAGRLAAVRALGLAEGISEEGARLLVKLSRRGAAPVRRAAQWALGKIAARHRLGSVEALRKKLDMAAAWQDGGLAEAPSRVWWDIAGYRVKLSVAAGKVEVSAWGPERKKKIPAPVRAHPLFAEVQEARRALARAYTIFRERLEEAMTLRRAFGGEHFRLLFRNPAFRSLVERLVVRLNGEEVLLEGLGAEAVEGFLRDCEFARILHPLEMWNSGTLARWQESIAARGVVQPYKQCFREIYPLEAWEGKQTHCVRFSGQPIMARKAYALLRRRGYSPCRGDAYLDWPSAGLRAHFVWAEQEKEGLWQHLVGGKQAIPLLSGPIYFERLEEKAARGKTAAAALPLEEVDPIVFSETLRDADLIVSAAAAGEEGFSSRQTLEIRAALVRNLARLLNLPGVRVEPGSPHAFIQGERGSYRVHLGSGRVLMEPSGRHLAFGLKSSKSLRALGGLTEESADSRTIAILEAVAALAHDGAISDAEFLAALSPA